MIVNVKANISLRELKAVFSKINVIQIKRSVLNVK